MCTACSNLSSLVDQTCMSLEVCTTRDGMGEAYIPTGMQPLAPAIWTAYLRSWLATDLSDAGLLKEPLKR